MYNVQNVLYVRYTFLNCLIRTYLQETSLDVLLHKLFRSPKIFSNSSLQNSPYIPIILFLLLNELNSDIKLFKINLIKTKYYNSILMHLDTVEDKLKLKIHFSIFNFTKNQYKKMNFFQIDMYVCNY